MTAVLVTGGSGFLGRHVIPELVDRGYEVVATARTARAASIVEAAGARSLGCDFDEPGQIDDAFTDARAELLVNLVSLGAGYAEGIVAAAAESGLDRGVYISSTAIFTTLDAPSKPRRLAGEQVVTSSALSFTVIRPTMIYGAPGDRNLERLLALLRRAPVVPVPGGGDRLQQPVHVDDLAVAIVDALESPATVRRCYELAGPEPITFRGLIEQASRAVGQRPAMLSIPLGPTIAGVGLYERIVPNPRLKVEQIERLAEDKAFEIDDARHDLGFDPRPFDEGISEEARLLGISPVIAGRARIVGPAADRPWRPELPATMEHFDEVALGWVRRYEDRPSFKERLRVLGPIVKEVCALANEARVLDVGGGPGVFSTVASISAARVVCLDPSVPMIESGVALASRVVALVEPLGEPDPDRITRVAGTLDCIGANSSSAGSFDVVMAVALLEYLDRPDEAIRAMARLVRPGGALVLTVPNEASVLRRVEDVFGSLGATAGVLARSERLRSRSYVRARPGGNRVAWMEAARDSELAIERIEPLALAGSGLAARVVPTTIVVMRRR